MVVNVEKCIVGPDSVVTAGANWIVSFSGTNLMDCCARFVHQMAESAHHLGIKSVFVKNRTYQSICS